MSQTNLYGTENILNDKLPDPRELPAFAEQLLGFPLEPKQRELLSKAGRRVMVNCSRQWGKSMLASVALLWHAIGHPGSTALIVGPSQRQTGELLNRVRILAYQLGLGRLKASPVHRHSLALPNLARIIALPGREDTIRGFTDVSMLVIDEAAMVDDEILPAVRPMLTQKRGTIWMMSTPKGPLGFFYREWTSASGEWERVSVPATECERFTSDALEFERVSLGARRFAREFLCQFVRVDEALIEEDWLDRMLSPDLTPLHEAA